MDWMILGIEPTKDKKAIKTAYRTQLKSVNPEEKPEEFKALRAAYEEAMKLADQEEPARDESPVGLWTEKLRALYWDFAARIQPENWSALLAEDICTGLDTRPLAEEALLKFLMEDFYLPQSVWQVLDRHFYWMERSGELYEKYPRDFVDYAVLNGIRYGANLPYEMFVPGKNAVDCDQYRRLYYQANQSSPEDLPGVLEKMEGLSESHPYGELLSYRAMLNRGEIEAGREGYRKLAEAYPKDGKLLLEWAGQCMNAENWIEGEKYSRRVLELQPEWTGAKQMLSDCLAKQGQYEEAKKLVFQLMDAAGGDQKRIYELRNNIRIWNEALIKEWEEALAASPEDAELKMKLGWCYLQNDRDEEALALCESMDSSYDDAYDYHNLYAKVVYAMNRHEEALVHLAELERLIREMKPDGTEKTADRIKGLPEKLQMQGSCLMGLGRSEEAVTKYEQAMEVAPDSPEVLTHMGRLLCMLKNYERAAEIFEKLTVVMPGSYHGFFLLAQTYFDLGRDRDAFDAVNRALELDGGDLGVYVLKMRILLRNGVWQGVRETLDFLHQHGITDEINVLWCEAQLLEYGEEQKEKALEKYRILAERIEKGEYLEEASKVFYRILIFEAVDLDARKKEDRDRMLELANKGLSYNAEDFACLDYKAWLLKQGGERKESLELYHRLEKVPRRSMNVEEELAGLYYKDLSRDADKALHYYRLLLEQNEEAVFNFYAGTCCKYLEDYEESERYFKRVQEMNPDGIDGYNGMSYLYDTMGRYEESLEQIDKVIERAIKRDGDQSSYFYHKARILRRLNRPQDAAHVVDELNTRYNKDNAFREKFDIYCQFGLWDAVEKGLLKSWSWKNLKDKNFLAAKIDLELFTGQIDKARASLKKLKGKLYAGDEERLTLLMAELDGDEETQMNIWKKRAEGRDNKTHETMNMAQVQWWCGHYDKAKEYARETLEQLEEIIPGNKMFEALYRGRKCIVLAMLGRMDEARAELAAVRQLPLCETCNYCTCKDADIFEANMEEIAGNWEKALELHLAGMEKWPDDLDFTSGARRMMRKGIKK